MSTMNIYDRLIKEYPTLSKGRKRIAEYILNHGEEAAFMNAAELAEKANISESVVVRFSSWLGYPKYINMQKDLREELKKSMNVVERMNQYDQPVGSTDEMVKNVLDNDLDNINKTCKNIDLEALDALVDRMIASDHIGLVATRAGMSIALTMEIFLNELLDKANLINPGYLTGLDRIRNWGENDIIFAIVHSGRSNYIEKVLDFARSRKCHIVLITDSLTNPACRYSDQVIVSIVEGVLLTLTAPMVITNILLYLVYKKLQKESETFNQQMKLFNEVLELTSEL